MPKDFFPMEFEHLNLLRKGFYRKREWQQDVMRNAVAKIITPWLSKEAKPELIWPLRMDKIRVEESNQRTKEVLKKHQQGGFEYIKKDGVIIAVNKN